MGRREQTKGECGYCRRMLTRAGMARHLGACPERAEQIAESLRSGKAPSAEWLHLLVQDAYGGDYWLHLEMDASLPLEVLDRYLRSIWLECCGHMSQFSEGHPWRGPTVSMSMRARRAFRGGIELVHVYDLGTESRTKIRLVGSRQGPRTTDRPLELMCRNRAPEFECAECGRPATSLCLECVYDDASGMLCEEHVAGHAHDEYEIMPVVNSPRMGVCGYTGPAEPPY